MWYQFNNGLFYEAAICLWRACSHFSCLFFLYIKFFFKSNKHIHASQKNTLTVIFEMTIEKSTYKCFEESVICRVNLEESASSLSQESIASINKGSMPGLDPISDEPSILLARTDNKRECLIWRNSDLGLVFVGCQPCLASQYPIIEDNTSQFNRWLDGAIDCFTILLITLVACIARLLHKVNWWWCRAKNEFWNILLPFLHPWYQ